MRLLIAASLLASCAEATTAPPDGQTHPACESHTECPDGFCYSPGTPGSSRGCVTFCDVDKDCPGDQVCRCVGGFIECTLDFIGGHRQWWWGCFDLGSEFYPGEY